jgi:hypothetical protein
MALYKEHLLNKIEDDLAGRNNNWGALEDFMDGYAADSVPGRITTLEGEMAALNAQLVSGTWLPTVV